MKINKLTIINFNLVFYRNTLQILYTLNIMDIEDFHKHLQTYLKDTKDDWNYITPIEYYNKYYNNFDSNRNHILIDIRRSEDYHKGHIKGAQNVYWLDILKKENLNKLPVNNTIFLICYVGHTSSQVMTLLKLLGYNVVSIKFGYGISPTRELPVAGWVDYGLPMSMA